MSSKAYGTRPGAPFKKGHAQEIGEFIENISDRTPENILNAVAINKEHILYSYIEWDNKKAGYEYRLQQIRNIVNHITIETKKVGEDLPVRAFFSVKKERNGKTPIYVTLNMAFSNEYYRNQILSQAKSELRNWRERYKQYKELSGIIKAISPFID